MRLLIKTSVILVAVLVALILVALPTYDRREWKRDQPLLNPIDVECIDTGAIVLVDGRSIVPAGITWRDDLEPGQRDAFLTAATAQGVEIIRELDENRSFALVGPKFDNWCGTSRTWAGTYQRAPLSELAVVLGFAEPDTTHTELTALERWRLEGALSLRADAGRAKLTPSNAAIRFDGRLRCFQDLDLWIEATTGTAPPSE